MSLFPNQHKVRKPFVPLRRNKVPIRSNRKSARPKKFGPIHVLSPIHNKPIQTRSIRYASDAAQTTSVTYQNLMDILLVTTSASTTAYRLFEAVKLKSVTITLLPDNSSGAGTFAFEWDGNNSPHQEDVLIYAQGESFRQRYLPPEDSPASWWITTNTEFQITDQVFTMIVGEANVKVILDLAIEYVITDGAYTAARTLDAAASVTGICAVTLDSSNNIFVPVDLVTCTI